jgi:hypothetical protein
VFHERTGGFLGGYMDFLPKKREREQTHDDMSKLGKRTEVMSPKNRPDHGGSVPVF